MVVFCLGLTNSCTTKNKTESQAEPISSLKDTGIVYLDYKKKASDLVISREAYRDQLYGFWLGECIANWTGLVTEMDKIGNIGEIKTGDFYTIQAYGVKEFPVLYRQP